MREKLSQIVLDNELHKKWLNTLSYMECAGARKISACEDPVTVDIIQLKHAAEEHRHAYYLKKQIQKLDADQDVLYRNTEMLAPVHTRQYLHQLDVQCSRYLKEQFGLSGKDLRYAAYLFVTYVIEVRADYLYPIYQDVLTAQQSKVTVKSIIAEEEGHLEEMSSLLERFDQHWQQHADTLAGVEAQLFEEWFAALSKEVSGYERIGITVA